MKILLATIISFTLVLTAEAQSFEVTNSNTNYHGFIGNKITVPIKIKNLTSKPVQVVIKRIDQVIGTSQVNYFCWDNTCFESTIEQIPVSKKIDPHETSLKFQSVLETGLVAGYSTVKYLIYNRDNPDDAIIYEVSFTVEDDKEKRVIFYSESIKINDVYPNPVSDFAMIDYNILDEEVNAKIIVHNVLGSVMGEYELPWLENKIKINTEDFNPGVYFYTLYIDNDGVMTRKLIVRK